MSTVTPGSARMARSLLSRRASRGAVAQRRLELRRTRQRARWAGRGRRRPGSRSRPGARARARRAARRAMRAASSRAGYRASYCGARTSVTPRRQTGRRGTIATNVASGRPRRHVSQTAAPPGEQHHGGRDLPRGIGRHQRVDHAAGDEAPRQDEDAQRLDGRGAREEGGAAREERDRHREPARAPPLGDVRFPHPADEQRRRGIEREEIGGPLAGGQAEEHEPGDEPAEREQERRRRLAVRVARRPRRSEAVPRAAPGRPRQGERARDEEAPRQEPRREVAEVLVPRPVVHPAPRVPLDLLVHERLAQVADAVARDGRAVPAEHDRGEDGEAGPEPEPPGHRAERPGQGEVERPRGAGGRARADPCSSRRAPSPRTRARSSRCGAGRGAW